MSFDSDIVYDANALQARWGGQADAIQALCRSETAIKANRRLGYGGVMSALVFYHSIPNNLPGILWSKSGGWIPLFPSRSLPGWCVRLLEQPFTPTPGATGHGRVHRAIDSDTFSVLVNIRRGVRTDAGIGMRMDCDIRLVRLLIERCLAAGFVSDSLRLTQAGRDALKKKEKRTKRKSTDDNWNRALYIPTSWCTG